jgi:hypothetical protein
MTYTPKDFGILSKIQESAMKTALSTVFAVFKYLSSRPDFKANLKNIKSGIHEDFKSGIDTEQEKPLRGEEIVDKAINALMENQFLERKNDEIILTDLGIHAIELLGYKS